MQTIIFANNKGGVGKTTLALLLTNHLSNLGYRVLVSDWDDQRNFSGTIAKDERFKTLPFWDFLRGRRQIETGADASKLVALQATDDILDIGEKHFDKIVKSFSAIDENYDFHIMDLPPAVSPRLLLALTLADVIFVPMTPTAYSIESSNRLFELLGELEVRDKFGGFVLNMIRPNDRFADEILNDKDMGDLIVADLKSYRYIETSISHAGDINRDLSSGQNRHARDQIRLFLDKLCERITLPPAPVNK